MKMLLKNHWKELAIVFVYILVACLAYGVWFNSLWHKWYINLITILVIIAIGVVIGFFYIKGMDKEKAKEEQKEPSIEEPIVEIKESEGEN
ncbi:hypothetical protein EI71_00430 [Anaeroplasma bactoclasticum]|jgi:uncharacterized protein YneF (UPF0154 family)|uniref:Uncharacterized protein n=1 Tax=Anaeroplasma bactoclasticum TaxID=2088 RepID=A0A397RWJ2_9MOLU|nr:hypothetical protein [Anaeroplasma bactoclasticum]RIA78118.1 hypothetical protein EI71_00430 [Anaeroplasma bactoclasticum]